MQFIAAPAEPEPIGSWRLGVAAELVAVWALYALVAAAILVTYSRLPAGELYHVSGSGLEAGAGRVLVFLNYSTALVALPAILLLRDRLAGALATIAAAVGLAASAVVLWPGVVDQADLDAKLVNVVPALGVVVAVALTIAVARRGGIEPFAAWGAVGDRLRLAVAAAVLVLGVPWLAADLGLSFDGVPVLGTLWQSGELRSQPGVAGLHPAVHHGHHHGMDGVLLVVSALLLSRTLPAVRRRGLRRPAAALLSLMLAYGVAEVANDFWIEQVVKRGWTDWEVPDMTRPSISVGWGLIVLGSLVVYGAWFGRLGPARPPSAPSSATSPPAVGTPP